MKVFIPFLFFFLLVSCKAQNSVLITEKQEFKSTSDCPKDGVCSVELIPNSSLILHTDTIGMNYATVEKGERIVFKFSYSRNVDKQYLDGHYIEEIYIEFDRYLSELNLKDKELQNVSLLFNRACFCKGSTGFYTITKGNLTVKKINKKTYNIQLDFKVDEVPQVITSINETITLK